MEKITIDSRQEQVMIVVIGEATSFIRFNKAPVRDKKLIELNLHVHNGIHREYNTVGL